MSDLRKESRHFTTDPWWVYLTWQGIKALADDFGLLDDSPSDIAGMFMRYELDRRHVTVARIIDVIAGFADGDDPLLVRYDHDGKSYLAIRKWQDYQRLRTPGKTDSPCPPTEILQKLSPATAAFITENIGRFVGIFSVNSEPEPDSPPASPPLQSPLSPSPVQDICREGPISVKSTPKCALCRKPLNSLLQDLHDAHRARFPDQACLLVDPPRDNRRLRTLLESGRDRESIAAVYALALREPTDYLKRAGYSVPAFVYDYPKFETAWRASQGARSRMDRLREQQRKREMNGGG